MPALLERLEGVRATGAGKWLARCPAHDDRTPSLSIRETDDGTILLHDFAGCSALAICQAIGIEFRDLFPAREIRRVDTHARGVPRLSAAERLELIEHEITVAVLILHDALEHRNVTEADWQRLAQARARIGMARYVG
jgi:hypothetical protein